MKIKHAVAYNYKTRLKPLKPYHLLTGLFIILFTYTFIVNAWIGDDVYITFRTVDNFIKGLGLVWNIGERVQSYTHPLWMFLLSFFYFFTSDVFYTTITVSFIFSLLAVGIIYFQIERDSIWKILFFIFSIIASRAFMDYTTSGLENPLSYFLISLFYMINFHGSGLKNNLSQKKILLLFFIASLAYLNRADTILLYLPMLIYIIVSYIKKLGIVEMIVICVIGTLPITLWISFSMLYYGFPFPNTAYAKLNTGIPIILLIKQGIKYFYDSLSNDPVTLLIIISAIALAVIRRKKEYIIVSAGIVLYFFYILKVGGCFMSGRFFSIPFLLAIILLLKFSDNIKLYMILTPFIIVIILLSNHSPIKTSKGYKYQGLRYGIGDEKSAYFPKLSLINSRKYNETRREWITMSKYNNKNVIVEALIGHYGYYLSKNTYIIDRFALSDPLLSKLPIFPYDWRIGHFARWIPKGYIDSIQEKKNLINDPYLKLFYDKLLIITRGRIFDYERLKAIFLMNIGAFQHLLDSYLTTNDDYLVYDDLKHGHNNSESFQIEWPEHLK